MLAGCAAIFVPLSGTSRQPFEFEKMEESHVPWMLWAIIIGIAIF